MTKNVSRLTLAALALVLMGSQWTYARVNEEPKKHKKVQNRQR